MPTPIGHALAGLAVAWSAEPPSVAQPLGRALARPLTLACIALAVLPDLDLLYPLMMHRAATHSIGASLLVTIIAAGVTGWVTGRINWRIAFVCGAAHASHIVTDWLGTDRNYAPYGIQMFWPFDTGWYISGREMFLPVERREPFSVATIRVNIAAAIREIAVLGSVVLAVWIAGRWRHERSPRRSERSRSPSP